MYNFSAWHSESDWNSQYISWFHVTNDLLGQFIPQNHHQRTFICGTANDEAYIGHSNGDHTNFQNVTFIWRAPFSSDGFVDFL